MTGRVTVELGTITNSNGNTFEVMTAGHQIRNRIFDSLQLDTIDTGEIFDCVVERSSQRFLNTDLSGMPDHRTPVGEAHGALSQLLDQVLVQ